MQATKVSSIIIQRQQLPPPSVTLPLEALALQRSSLMPPAQGPHRQDAQEKGKITNM
jgi:hypothetical protein